MCAVASETSVCDILRDALVIKDDAIVSYMSDIIKEAVEQNQLFEMIDLYNLLSEPLNTYQLCSEQEFCSVSQSIFDALIKNKYVKNPMILRAEILKSIRIDMTVKALYWEDQQWYDAKIKDVEVMDDINKICVTFTEYGNSEWIDPIHIKLPPKQIEIKKIKIADKMKITDDDIKFINYQIYHGDDKPQNDECHIYNIVNKETKQQKARKAEISKVIQERQIELKTEHLDTKQDIDADSEDMLNLNGHYFCYKSKCNGYLYLPNEENVLEFICPDCESINCILCRSVHDQTFKLCISPSIKLKCQDYHFLLNNEFLKYWQCANYKSKTMKYLRKSNMCISYGVRKGCHEWQWVINCMKNKHQNQYQVIQIERIQNANLWTKYYDYYKSLVVRGIKANQMNVWHGTRKTQPSIIWKNLGFDVGHAAVSGCIWFAMDNAYSMRGFKYTATGKKYQVFLAFVAGGDTDHVKLIRNNSILNVYKNEATYPAYVVTYNMP